MPCVAATVAARVSSADLPMPGLAPDDQCLAALVHACHEAGDHARLVITTDQACPCHSRVHHLLCQQDTSSHQGGPDQGG